MTTDDKNNCDCICIVLKCLLIGLQSQLPALFLSPPFTVVHATMKSALSSLTSERERLKQCLDHETCPPTSPQVVGLKNTLATVCGTHYRTFTNTEMLSVSRNSLGIPLSFYTPLRCPPTPLVRRDTLSSLLEGLLAVGVMFAHLYKNVFNSHVSCG